MIADLCFHPNPNLQCRMLFGCVFHQELDFHPSKMGVKAAVVYDVPRHKTVILRTQSVSTTERYEVLDTISSFSQHCESLRGMARSVTEVSAMWGGPPFVNYIVVKNRLRVIIIWDEGAADLGASYDVYQALSRLEKAVASVADGLIDRAVDAVSHVYDEAGYALLGDYPSDLIEEAPSPTKGSRLFPRTTSASLSRKSSATEPKRQKSNRLFGRIGSVIKGSKAEKTESKHRNTPLNSSVQEPSESGAMSTTTFGSEAALEDIEGDIWLADEVFTWADFGEPLPDGPGNLDWFEALLKGDVTKKRPRPPLLRPQKSPKTPLKIPTLADLQQRNHIETESMSLDRVSDRKASDPAPPVPSPPTAPGVSQQTSATGTPAPPTPNTAMTAPTATPLQTSTTSFPHSSGSMLPSGISKVNSSLVPSPGTIQNSARSVPQSLGSVAQSPAVPPPAPSTNSSQRNVTVTASPLITNSLPPQSGSTPTIGQQVPGNPLAAPAPTPLSSVPSSQTPVPVQPPEAAIPPALRNVDDFDVSGLGGYKDTSTVGETRQKEEDELIRAKMNEFAMTMQSGNFRLALQQVIAALRYLSGVNPRRDRETITCANYYLAQKILIRNAALEQELTGIPGGTQLAVQRHIESALLTMFLAEMKHLTPRHRAAAMKVAVEKNSIVGNFGMCARWLRHLVEKAPAGKKADFANRLQICVKNGERNSHMPPTNRICYNTLQVVTSPYGVCGVCEAIFHPMLAGVTVGQVCGVCFVGAIERKA